MRSPHTPAAARVLALQRSAGNRATTRVLQRQPTPKTADDTLDAVHDRWVDLWGPAGLAQQQHYTEWRAEFLADVHRDLDPLMRQLYESQAAGTLTPGAVDRFWDLLLEYENMWVVEHAAGEEAWQEVRKQYEAEVRRLREQADFAGMEAAKILEREFVQAERYVKAAGDGMVAEDFGSLALMMAKGTHIEEGGRRAEKVGQVFEADLAEYEAEEAASLVNLASDSSVLKTAWQIFGWDSVGEFAADVALTVLTFGIAKWIRAGAKAEKARRRAKRIKELRALLTARRAKRAEEKLSRGRAAAHLMKGFARDAFKEQLKWLKDNWSKVGRKIGTDITATVLQGKDPHALSTAARRAAKEQINDAVMKYFGKDEKAEKKWMWIAWAAFFKGKTKAAEYALASYFTLNVRRRLLVNTIYYGTIEVGKADIALQNLPLRKIAIGTAAECIQDIVTTVPVFDLPGVKDAIETLRKYIAKEVEGLVS